jgi:hypothetical protein
LVDIIENVIPNARLMLDETVLKEKHSREGQQPIEDLRRSE